MKKALLTNSISLALLASSSIALPVFAEENSAEDIEKITVTGSAIKRTDLEGALPLEVISAEDIKQSGVTSVPDLVAQIPSMQGFQTAGQSVGGGGGGIQTASLKDIGAQYTLVLLNGKRMAAADSGGTVNLNSIPLSAIERVEILKDGASALYGSDAIAGVVNFILKRDLQEFNVSARFDKPKDTSSSNLSFSGGFGDLDEDGFNIMGAYSRDTQDSLKSTDRDFAKSGFIPFAYNEKNYIAAAGSPNAIPANAYVDYYKRDENGDKIPTYEKDDDGNPTDKIKLDDNGNVVYATDSTSFNPYRESNNGNCHTTSAPVGSTCAFDYTSTLEIQPETTRDNVFLQGLLNLGEHEVYTTAAWSKFNMVTRIAPYPTGGFTLPIDSSLVQSNVMPHLPDGVDPADVTSVVSAWRALPGGNRTNDLTTTTWNFVAGIRGDIDVWSYDFSVSHATSNADNDIVTGYPIQDDFLPLLRSGDVNVFAAPEDLSEEQQQKVKDTMYSGPMSSVETALTSIEGKISGELFDLDAGTVYLGLGFDTRMSSYKRTTSEADKNEIILFRSASQEYDLSRNTAGVFAEVIVPVIEDLEVTTSVRYDTIGAVEDARLNGNKSVGEDMSDVTYKISSSYRVTDELMLRASYGTGFKAPSMREIAEPINEFGVTGNVYSCPFTGPDADFCYSDPQQYVTYAGGNPNLEPEKSTQMNFGFVWSNDEGTSVGVDYWNVEMTDQVTSLTADQIFGDPKTYSEKFIKHYDKGRERDVWAILQTDDNTGKANYAGIDWHFEVMKDFSIGTLKTSFVGTYMIESESLRVGSTDIFDSSIGKVGTNSAVTFRNIINMNNTFTHGDFTHNLNIKAKSGYKDTDLSGWTVYEAADDGSFGTSLTAKEKGLMQPYVNSFITVDYRLNYALGESMNIAVGAKNLFDRKPPLTFNKSAGHQVGYSTRYHDPYGRTIYVQADYTF